MSRLDPKVRKESILEAAIAESRERGYLTVTRKNIADRAGCAEGLVSRYFNTMPQLRRAVVRAAIKGDVYEIIAQATIAMDKQAEKVTDEQRHAAFRFLESKHSR